MLTWLAFLLATLSPLVGAGDPAPSLVPYALPPPVPQEVLDSEKDKNWEQLFEKDGVKVMRRMVPGSSVFLFRGEGLIDAPMAKIIGVVRDSSRSKEWVDGVVEIKAIREISHWERLDYYQISVPWPFQNRDFIYHTKVSMDPVSKTVVFTTSSEEDPGTPPRPGVVRGFVHRATMMFRSIDNGKRVYGIGEAHVDPKGALPAWLFNLVQKRWPYNTFMNVRKQLSKKDIKVDPIAASLFR